MCFLICLLLFLCPTLHAATVTFDGSQTYQVIEGFGVNANHRSWNNDELKPVLDALIDQAGMTLFRVVFDKTNWEASNDNSDPTLMNWTYYNSVYGSARFTPLWEMFAYLNSRGITNGAFFNFMGNGPSWLGGSPLRVGMEEEWAEMIVSLLMYARNTRGLQFHLVAPDNEPDLWAEGIQIPTASQYATVLHELADLLDLHGLSDVRFMGPDLAGNSTTYMPAMMADEVVMAKLERFGAHSYSGGGSDSVYEYIQSSAYTNRPYWITEFNVWCSTCDSGTRGTYDWNYCRGTADYLLHHLESGASGGIVWEGYDSFYAHPPYTWSFWGLFSVDDEEATVKTYTPRKNFYTLAQISKFVRPGARSFRVNGSTAPFSPLLAFYQSDLGQISIVGINASSSAAVLSGSLASLPAVSYLEMYYTSATTNLADGGRVSVESGLFNANIPADCVFTLSGFTSVVTGSIARIGITPTNAVVVPGGTQRFIATATDGLGHRLDPQPTFSWSVSGGGTIDNEGLFIAGSAIGGPFNVLASSGGVRGTALVSVVSVSGGTIGNTKEGTLTDTLWSDGSWINASRFQATSNMMVSTIKAKVTAIAGKYKCALYTDKNTQPNQLLSDTAEVRNPESGWQSFPLSSSLVLTDGNYFWLAIWSDNVNGGVYYSDNEGTLRWGQYDYGTWPDPIITTDSDNLQYCIYAMGTTPITELISMMLTPTNSSIWIGGSQQFRAVGSYLDGSTQDLSSQATWISGDAEVATVSAGGLAMGISAGTTTISAVLSGVMGSSILKVQLVPLISIWPTNVVPGVVDEGPDRSVELGVKFKSDVSGSITGIRFYKAAANTGVHIGNLWTSNGTKLATATFSNETASGWQQVFFATPVAIASNSVYVASYHANNGHYSADTNYFAAHGVDNPPLHALTNGVFGGNGVYAYGTNSFFPNQTYNAANYWVDVLFQIASKPVLTSLTLTPTNPSILIGAGQQFTAIGTYSDESTQNITTQATWSSSNTGVATINTEGRATSVSVGTTIISATLAGVTGTSSLEVEVAIPPPLTLESISVMPTNLSILIGAGQQFTAIGTYSDGSTQNITTQATWSSSSTGVATINTEGRATSVSVGTTIISAILGGVTGSTVLTVQPLPLAITTTSLSSGMISVAYSATLTASGGTLPYTWSIASGSLPFGLMLNATNGAISGTPSATGTFSFAAQVKDAGIPSQTSSLPLSIIITSMPPSVISIWSTDVIPGVVDDGPDRSVELGVKFKSDVSGSITGIRFYKAAANTGVHIGNLWTSNGAQIATATFSNETASGWQQVFFSTPMAIASNTVYVASYHASRGHYSADNNYFADKGVDNPPLHALANGVFGSNGVYRYGPNSIFPNQSYNALNYWVDVMFQPESSTTLTSIVVTPNTASIIIGASQQFIATRTYSDGSTQDVTTQAMWISSNTGVATINTQGVAKGVSVGTTILSAILGSVTGSTVLTVQPLPFVITTTSLSNGMINVAYSATLTASGGTLPYTWSIASGSLPSGLTLNSTNGVIAGTPSATGTFDFTVQIRDTGSPIQTTNNLFSISIMSMLSIWPTNAVPGVADGGLDRSVELGVKFKSDVSGSITGIRFYKAAANTGVHIGNLWTSNGTKLATAIFSNETASGWQQVFFATPVVILSNTVYVASYHANNGHYSADTSYFTAKGVDNPPLHALTNGVFGGNGVYAYGTSSLFPNQTWNAANYWVDIFLSCR